MPHKIQLLQIDGSVASVTGHSLPLISLVTQDEMLGDEGVRSARGASIHHIGAVSAAPLAVMDLAVGGILLR